MVNSTLIEVADVDFKNVNVWSILAVLAIIAISFKSISIPVLLVASIEAAIAINKQIILLQNPQIPMLGFAGMLTSCRKAVT